MEATPCRPATAGDAEICADEERVFSRVREAVTRARGAPRRGPNRSGLAALRDDYAAAGEEDRPALLAQMAEEAARVEALSARRLPDSAAPYFGHMRLRSGGRSRDVLLGECPFVDPASGVTIVDWRRAPIAEVFFTCDEGDDYEIEVEGRIIEGVLERRHLVAFDSGELSSISVEGGSLRKVEGQWRLDPDGLIPSLSTGAGARGRAKPRLGGALDPQQIALIERDPGEPLVVLGSAGCGKTTVALHRVAELCRRYPERFAPAGVLIIVPEPGLRRFAERLLADLGIEGAAVRTFDDWIRAEARRVFPWLRARESPDPPFAVSRMKRHPGMLAAIDRIIDDLARSIAERIERRLERREDVTVVLAERAEPILADRLENAERALSERAPPARRRAIAEAFREEHRKLSRVRDDHLRLVGDRELLSLAVRASGGELSANLVEEVARHTGLQLDDPSEVRFAHVDAGRLATLDGRSLDEGTPDAITGSVDVEDYALLFELLFRKTGKSKTPAGELSTEAHLVLDEAQELAPVELRVLGRAAAPESGSITVAGDAAQRIDRTSHFDSWDGVIAALGARAEPAYLETSYRCPRPIVEFAHAILGADAPAAMPRAAREGAAVVCTALPSEGHAAVAMSQALRRLREEEPWASVGVLTSDAKTARGVHEVLSRALPARLVVDGDFIFGPGVEVAEVAEAKGLEFDVVVVPDADALRYPDTQERRRLLHVAATRAAERLWILSPGAPSPILKRSRECFQSNQMSTQAKQKEALKRL